MQAEVSDVKDRKPERKFTGDGIRVSDTVLQDQIRLLFGVSAKSNLIYL